MKRRQIHQAAVGAIIAAIGGSFSAQALAQSNWPTGQPIRMIVGFAPGGPTDIVARVIAQRLGKLLDAPVVVVNRPGANGNIAADTVAKSRPDGYTFLYNSSSLTLSPAIYARLPFDLNKDFSYVAGTVAMPSVLVTSANSHAQDFAGWLQYVKRPGPRPNYGTPGVGNSSHLAMEMILKSFGAQAVHIPYKGSAEARTALLSGEIQFQIDSINAALPLIKSGRLRALAVLSSKRAVDLPNVPTVAESGLPGFEIDTWQGVAAPANTPAAIVNRMSAELALAIASPDVKKILMEQGAYSISSTPDEYAKFVRKETDRYAQVVKEIGLTPQD